VASDNTSDAAVQLSIVNRDFGPLTLPAISYQLTELNSLIFVSTLTTVLEWEVNKPGEPRLFEWVWDVATEASAEFTVERLSYESPMDLLMAAKAGIGVTSESAGRLLKFFTNLEDYRVKHAQADIEVLSRKIIEDDLKFERRQQRQRHKYAKKLDKSVIEAASALSRVDQIHVIL
jgi:hypothetical protein